MDTLSSVVVFLDGIFLVIVNMIISLVFVFLDGMTGQSRCEHIFHGCFLYKWYVGEV